MQPLLVVLTEFHQTLLPYFLCRFSIPTTNCPSLWDPLDQSCHWTFIRSDGGHFCKEFEPNKKWAVSPLISPPAGIPTATQADKFVCILSIRRFRSEERRVGKEC